LASLAPRPLVRMDFRILGPLQALDEGRAIALGGGKQRALLAVFLLHANETLSTDHLIGELWGERPPARAVKTVQVYVSRLRRALAGSEGDASHEVLVTREHGYELALDPEQLDANRFEALVAQGRSELAEGRPERATAALEEALSLWRGAPLTEFAYESFAQREIGRLDDLRVAAQERLIEAKLALGAHAEVVGRLEALIAEYPYREGLRAQLMLALYRSERQADALQAYQDARRTLVEELGIEPGERLRELERAILGQDPALHLAAEDEPAAEPVAESPRGAFVGRQRELAQLVGGLDDAFAGRGRLFLLVGEPGIGKSRLAEELIAQARARGAQVLVGRCWEAGGAPAYWPWVQSLRAYAREAEPDALRAQLGAGAADLANIVPEFRERLPDLPEPPSLESEAARFRLFDAATEFLRRASESRPIVLLLDDLHAADAPSLLLLRFVGRQLASSRMLVLGAYRDVDPIPGQPLTETLVEVAREPGTRGLALGGLSEREVGDYIELSTGAPGPPRLARAIHVETEGNPLFVSELVRLLDADGRIVHADTHPRIPQGVRAVIAQRVGRLSERCQDVLVAASVMGREFGLDALARLSQMPRDALLDVLDEAMAERVLGDVPGSPGRLRFGHALIRDTLYDELSSARRLQLHRDAAEALEIVYAADLDGHLAELAHHLFIAAPTGVGDEAFDYARRAGDRATTQLAYEEAVRLYEMALTLARDDVARCDLLLVLGDAQARGGDTPAAQQSFHQAADLAEALGLPEHLARAALGYGGRIIWEVSRGDVHHVPLLERASAALRAEDSPLRVRLLARLASGPLRDASFPPERKRALSEEALEMARRIGDPGTLAYALSGYLTANQSAEFTPKQPALATELVEVATEAGDVERAAEGFEQRAVARFELGDMRGAKDDFAAMAKLAEELRQPSHDWLVAVYKALVALLEGELVAAERLIAGARGVAERVLSWNATVSYGLQLYGLRREQGRLEEVEELVRRAVDEYPTYPIWRCVQAQLASELGYADEAHETLQALAADGFNSLPFDEEWLVSLGLLAETATTLGDFERAADLYQRLLPYGDRVAVCYTEASIGSVARYLGLLAATLGRLDDAERHFRAALEVNQRIGARPWLARTQEDYARMLIARATAGDHDNALQLLADARSTYRELGMDTWAQRASVEDQPPKGAAPTRSKK
jgi:DNA-binding SARP family transcriptional activator